MGVTAILSNILLKTLRDKRRSMLFWGIGLVSMAIIIMSFLPIITAESETIEAYIEILPEEFMAAFGGDIADISTPEGFLNAELFFFMTPILFLVFTVGLGAGAIAGDDAGDEAAGEGTSPDGAPAESGIDPRISPPTVGVAWEPASDQR